MSEITLVLKAVGDGEKLASERLLPLVYEELRRLAIDLNRTFIFH